MSDGRVILLFGVHNHQPAGNFDGVMAEAAAHAYHPFLEVLRDFPAVRLTVHCTGTLLAWLRERAGATFDLLGTLAARGQVEFLTGGFYEPILAILPDHDKVGQIQHLSEFLKSHFGARPRGMWLAERVWEPHLPRALAAAGVEFVLVDDRHFALAGMDPAGLSGYYLTEEQGARVAVFPISERLRYLVPFAEPGATLEYLASWRDRAAGLTLVDDGEKFGLWPGTHKHVYEDRWLGRFFEVLTATDWLDLATFGDYLDRHPATGAVYLPTASYIEMGLWALPTPARLELERAQQAVRGLADGERLARLLRGGFWRAFLVKYPEVGDLHWKVLRLSQAIQQRLEAKPDDGAARAARLALWRGQANDAYWHGVFGGCYLPHLRRAVKAAVLEAERLEAGADRDGVSCLRMDANGDGRDEVLIRTTRLSVTVHPERGGVVTELGFLPRLHDLADVLSRRPEPYHGQVAARVEASAGARTIHEARPAKEGGLEALLGYDRFRRASLLDGLFPPGPDLEPLEPWAAARVALGDVRLGARIDRSSGTATVVMSTENPSACPLSLEKTLSVSGSRLEATYRLRWRGDGQLDARWAVQWNLAMTAGSAAGRYFLLPGRPDLGSRGSVDDLTGLAIVDEWAGIEARLSWLEPARVGWAPVETVSVSEQGFERIFQGTALLMAWPLSLTRDTEWSGRIALDILAVPPGGS